MLGTAWRPARRLRHVESISVVNFFHPAAQFDFTTHILFDLLLVRENGGEELLCISEKILAEPKLEWDSLNLRDNSQLSPATLHQPFHDRLRVVVRVAPPPGTPTLHPPSSPLHHTPKHGNSTQTGGCTAGTASHKPAVSHAEGPAADPRAGTPSRKPARGPAVEPTAGTPTPERTGGECTPAPAGSPAFVVVSAGLPTVVDDAGTPVRPPSPTSVSEASFTNSFQRSQLFGDVVCELPGGTASCLTGGDEDMEGTCGVRSGGSAGSGAPGGHHTGLRDGDPCQSEHAGHSTGSPAGSIEQWLEENLHGNCAAAGKQLDDRSAAAIGNHAIAAADPDAFQVEGRVAAGSRISAVNGVAKHQQALSQPGNETPGLGGAAADWADGLTVPLAADGSPSSGTPVIAQAGHDTCPCSGDGTGSSGCSARGFSQDLALAEIQEPIRPGRIVPQDSAFVQNAAGLACKDGVSAATVWKQAVVAGSQQLPGNAGMPDASDEAAEARLAVVEPDGGDVAASTQNKAGAAAVVGLAMVGLDVGDAAALIQDVTAAAGTAVARQANAVKQLEGGAGMPAAIAEAMTDADAAGGAGSTAFVNAIVADAPAVDGIATADGMSADVANFVTAGGPTSAEASATSGGAGNAADPSAMFGFDAEKVVNAHATGCLEEDVDTGILLQAHNLRASSETPLDSPIADGDVDAAIFAHQQQDASEAHYAHDACELHAQDAGVDAGGHADIEVTMECSADAIGPFVAAEVADLIGEKAAGSCKEVASPGKDLLEWCSSGGDGGEVLFESLVDLNQLVFLGSDARYLHVDPSSTNTLVLGLHDGFYTTPNPPLPPNPTTPAAASATATATATATSSPVAPAAGTSVGAGTRSSGPKGSVLQGCSGSPLKKMSAFQSGAWGSEDGGSNSDTAGGEDGHNVGMGLELPSPMTAVSPSRAGKGKPSLVQQQSFYRWMLSSGSIVSPLTAHPSNWDVEFENVFGSIAASPEKDCRGSVAPYPSARLGSEAGDLEHIRPMSSSLMERQHDVSDLRAGIRRLMEARQQLDTVLQRRDSIRDKVVQLLDSLSCQHQQQSQLRASWQQLGRLQHLVHSHRLKLDRLKARLKTIRDSALGEARTVLQCSQALMGAVQRLCEAVQVLGGEQGWGSWKKLHAELVSQRCRCVVQLASLFQIGPVAQSYLEPCPLHTRLEHHWWAGAGDTAVPPPQNSVPATPLLPQTARRRPHVPSDPRFRPARPAPASPHLHPTDMARLTICGLELPSSLTRRGIEGSMGWSGEPDEEQRVAAALGYTAQVVKMLGVLLDVPLRYPISLRLSTSKILDGPRPLAHPPLPGTQPLQCAPDWTARVPVLRRGRAGTHPPGSAAPSVLPATLPLCYDGADRTRFAYAIFLLNKNIEQLLSAHGLASVGPSHVLHNLYNLILVAPSAVPNHAPNWPPAQPPPVPSDSAYSARAGHLGHSGFIPRGRRGSCDSSSSVSLASGPLALVPSSRQASLSSLGFMSAARQHSWFGGKRPLPQQLSNDMAELAPRHWPATTPAASQPPGPGGTGRYGLQPSQQSGHTDPPSSIRLNPCHIPGMSHVRTAQSLSHMTNPQDLAATTGTTTCSHMWPRTTSPQAAQGFSHATPSPFNQQSYSGTSRDAPEAAANPPNQPASHARTPPWKAASDTEQLPLSQLGHHPGLAPAHTHTHLTHTPSPHTNPPWQSSPQPTTIPSTCPTHELPSCSPCQPTLSQPPQPQQPHKSPSASSQPLPHPAPSWRSSPFMMLMQSPAAREHRQHAHSTPQQHTSTPHAQSNTTAQHATVLPQQQQLPTHHQLFPRPNPNWR